MVGDALGSVPGVLSVEVNLATEKARVEHVEGVALILADNYMEAIAKGRASQAIRRLLDLQAKTARMVRSNGATEEFAVEDVEVGDHVVVHPGEKIPVDGLWEGLHVGDSPTPRSAPSGRTN